MTATRILHVDTGTSWRGGQAQVAELLPRLPPDRVVSELLVPASSPIPARLDDPQGRIRIHHHPLRGEWDLAAALRLRSLCRRRDFHLVHAHSSRALGIAWLASVVFDLPRFVETRRLETPVARHPLSRSKYAAAYCHIANSETVREGLIESGVDPGSIEVIPSGIDLQRIARTPAAPGLIESLGLDPDGPVVGNVGALSPQKDQATFVRTAARVLEQYPHAQFVIAGEGELRDDLERRIRQAGIESRCVLAGFVDDIIGLMKTLDLFVLTSRYEGLCGTVMQAMACGVPVISSDVKGSREILLDGRTCRTVAPGDVNGFGDAIAGFLEGTDAYDRYAVHARELVGHYDYTRLADRAARFYERVAAG